MYAIIASASSARSSPSIANTCGGFHLILIGQYDSPYVRRVAIALHHYELPFEHRSWSVWGDAAKIAQYNPLRRVPTLLLEDGSALVETFAILDALDEFVGPERALLPASGAGRRDGFCASRRFAGVAWRTRPSLLLYSSLDLMQPSETWTERCRTQIAETFDGFGKRGAKSRAQHAVLARTVAEPRGHRFCV